MPSWLHTGFRFPAAWLCLAALIAAGCVLPPPIEEEPVVERPHWVDEEQVAPPPWRVFRVDLTDRDQEFYVGGAVENPDGDDLYFYWYLMETSGQQGLAPIYSDEELFVFEPCRNETVLRVLADSAGAFVEMYLELDVSDARRLKGEEGQELPEPRNYPEESRVVTVSWFLLFDGPCP